MRNVKGATTGSVLLRSREMHSSYSARVFKQIYTSGVETKT